VNRRAVNPTAEILRRAKVAIGVSLVENIDRRAPTGPLFGSLSRFLNRCLRMRTLDPAIAHMRDIHAVLGDQVEHRVGSAARESDEPGATLRSEHRFQIVWIIFETWNHLAAIAARTAIAWLLGFEHNRLHATFGKMQRGG
jgi:hypothetical protein